MEKNTEKIVYSESLIRLFVMCDVCFSTCLFVYGPFCHGALKLHPGISTKHLCACTRLKN